MARHDDNGRDVVALPKAHLHLHFTGSMSLPTLKELARARGMELPDKLAGGAPLDLPYDQRGWNKFQRLYDVARAVVRGEAALRQVVDRAAQEDAAEGSRRLELQVDPTSYASSVGGIEEALDIICDEARQASQRHGVQVGVIVAASRVRHPLDARTLARFAARRVGHGPGEVCAFGLNSNERDGRTPEWEVAFRIARRAGLPGVPHGGELLGPDHLEQVVAHLEPTRIGHGVRAVEDPALLERMVAKGIAFEVCPASNVQLGVYREVDDVPLLTLLAHGATVALGADDPLLFRSRLVDQYRGAREIHYLDDARLARLAKDSIEASFASDEDKRRWTTEVDAWLASPCDQARPDIAPHCPVEK